MKIWPIIVLLLVGAFVAWQLRFTLLAGVKEPKYAVVAKKDGYEIRQYKPYILAHITLEGTYADSMSEGFKILADYIFGNNSAQVGMPMTAPVIHEQEKKSVTMPMTAPVLMEKNTQGNQIAFVMPFQYTLKTLPQPLDGRITIEAVPAKTVAAYSFTWYATAARVAKQKKYFEQLLARDGIKRLSTIRLARYNPPFVLPFLMRNELLVDIENE